MVQLKYLRLKSILKNVFFLQIYDGPYLTSPLLLSHNGTTKPLSMRSSSNKLYIEFTAMNCHRNFMIDIDYTSVSVVTNLLSSNFIK